MTTSDSDYWRFCADKAAWAKEFLNLELPAFLREYDAETDGRKLRLLLAPVGHGKSWYAAKFIALHAICYNKNIRILIVSKKLGRAKENVQMIRREIETNDRLRAFYGLKPTEKWGDEALTVERTRILKEPTVVASGLYGQVEGLRPDFIIIDDMIDQEVTTSEIERVKTKNWLDGTVTPRLEPNGRMLVIGTRWDSEDVYNHIMKKPGWDMKVYAAYKPDGSALWPERWPRELLEAERAREGEIWFQFKRMNNPVALEGTAFRWDWIQWVDGPEPEYYRVIVGGDQAITKRELAKADPDATVGAIIGIGEGGILYLLDIGIAYVDANHAEFFHDLGERWGADEYAIESNAFQKLTHRDWNARYPKDNVWAEEHYATDKVTRILDLGPAFQSGQLKIWRGCRNLARLENEYKRFPHGAHDDILDALEMAVKRAKAAHGTLRSGVLRRSTYRAVFGGG